ncbi:3-deoxy-D-manno-octulosonic acid transferase [Paragemmobacter straminiformis]|uniref:3-deoxy-D-manno-octulosonic acid transferase n=1 Tax=Paragemmobacter straminiformis TaxID=2045119 RepID=A0A842I9N7_9RHOB|nr:3-deoxy-D-manno-octulosonic acid transferase [Gemmobacter straminiformis]MBC2836560.1 3-deoxy-D-manno-octulosonic acid transferase [Gemmobacter straminiformis]
MTTAPFTDPPAPPASALLWAYLGLTALLAPLAPHLLRRRLAAGKEDPARWREKLGETALPRPEGPLVWVHAVSVGEGLSVLPLLSAICGKANVLLTCTTVTSARLMATRAPQGVIVQFLPLDFPRPVRRFLRHWRPDVAVMVESEFWPRLIRETHRRAIPLLLVNARISDASLARWSRLGGLASALLRRFSALTAPDPAAARKLLQLGADPVRLQVTGSLKRGADRIPVDAAELARCRQATGQRPLWLAASTHSGEEAAAAAAHRLVQQSLPDALLILAPRHPDRAAAIRADLEQSGFAVSQRSRGDLPQGDIYLADTLGELGLWFDLCPLAFIGGSLEPVGGHNAYEPALHGAAILHGPHVENFADLYARLDIAGGAAHITTESLAPALVQLQDPALRDAMTQAARQVVTAEGDATERTAALIFSALAAAASSSAGASRATGPYAP